MVDFSISLLYKQKGGPPLGTTSLGRTVLFERLSIRSQFIFKNLNKLYTELCCIVTTLHFFATSNGWCYLVADVLLFLTLEEID